MLIGAENNWKFFNHHILLNYLGVADLRDDFSLIFPSPPNESHFPHALYLLTSIARLSEHRSLGLIHLDRH
jgi:hypothetical protein